MTRHIQINTTKVNFLILKDFYRRSSFWQIATFINISPIYNPRTGLFSGLYPQPLWIKTMGCMKTLWK